MQGQKEWARNKPWNKCWPGSGSGSGTACVAAAVVAVHGEADEEDGSGLGRTDPKMFCNMRRVGKFIINSMRQHGSQTFHMLLKMPHCTAHVPCPQFPVPIHPITYHHIASIHPIEPIQTQSVLPTSVGDFYLYIRTPRYTYVVQHVAASRHAKVC